MNNIVNAYPGPTLGIGDFNFILEQSKNFGGKPFANSFTHSGLKAFMDENRLVNVVFGPKSTWPNNKQCLKNIRKMLDKGVANHLCTLLFPNATLQYLPICFSNRSPIIQKA